MAELPAKTFEKTAISAASASNMEIYPRPEDPQIRVDKTTNPNDATRPIILDVIVDFMALCSLI